MQFIAVSLVAGLDGDFYLQIPVDLNREISFTVSRPIETQPSNQTIELGWVGIKLQKSCFTFFTFFIGIEAALHQNIACSRFA